MKKSMLKYSQSEKQDTKTIAEKAEEGVGTKTFIGVNKWKTRLTKSLTV